MNTKHIIITLILFLIITATINVIVAALGIIVGHWVHTLYTNKQDIQDTTDRVFSELQKPQWKL